MSATAPVARRDLMVLLLAIAGGSVDAMTIVGFDVLTAAQTGNTILLAVSVARGELTTGFFAAVSIAAYIIGAAMGEVVIVTHRLSVSWLVPVGRTLVAELVPLGVMLVIWRLASPDPGPATSAVVVALAAMAMGVQSAAVLRLDAGPTTTYVTAGRCGRAPPADHGDRRGRRGGCSPFVSRT